MHRCPAPGTAVGTGAGSRRGRCPAGTASPPTGRCPSRWPSRPGGGPSWLLRFGGTKPQGWHQLWAARGCSAASPELQVMDRGQGVVSGRETPHPARTVRCHQLHTPAPLLPSQHSDGLTYVRCVHHQPLGRPALCFHPDLVCQVEAEVFPAEVAGVGATGDVVFALFHFWGSPAPQGGGEDASSPLPQHALGPASAPSPQKHRGYKASGPVEVMLLCTPVLLCTPALLPSTKPPPQPLLLFVGGKTTPQMPLQALLQGRGAPWHFGTRRCRGEQGKDPTPSLPSAAPAHSGWCFMARIRFPGFPGLTSSCTRGGGRCWPGLRPVGASGTTCAWGRAGCSSHPGGRAPLRGRRGRGRGNRQPPP